MADDTYDCQLKRREYSAHRDEINAQVIMDLQGKTTAVTRLNRGRLAEVDGQ
jgi:hypothetical protein